MTQVTAQSIIDWLQDQVENKIPVAPHQWLDAGIKLVALVGGEHDKLFELEQIVSQKKVDLIQNEDMSVAKAKTIVEATDEYKQMKRQKAFINQIDDMYTASKKYASLKDNEMSF